MSQQQIVLIGAGGHAKVVADLLLEDGRFSLVGCLSSRAEEREVLGVPVLGSTALLPRLRHDGVSCAFVAIGDNQARARVTAEARQAGFSLVNVVSPHAVVSRRAQLGQGILVMPGAVINADAVIGDAVIVNTAATIDHDCQIGAFAHIGPGTNLAGAVRIGEATLLGVGCRAIPGVAVGARAVVGAGSVIVRDLPDGCTAFGAPARVKQK